MGSCFTRQQDKDPSTSYFIKLDICQNSSCRGEVRTVSQPIVGSGSNRKRKERGRSRFRCYKGWLCKASLCSAPPMMFASNSPYSPFFTSGLLSHSIFDGPRRGSLPTDKSKDVHQPQSIFSNQPEYRSFLSLDLAESQSMRSASLKQKSFSPPLVSCVSALFIAQLIVL